MKKKYPFKHVIIGNGKFLGKKLVQNSNFSITIHQKEYICDLEWIYISKVKRQNQTTDEEKNQIKGILGELNWFEIGSRPDLAAGCSFLQQHITKSTVENIIEVNRLVVCVHDFSGFKLKVKFIVPQNFEICI